MIKIGIAQTKNSTNILENFQSITKALIMFGASNPDVILFPECALSGFSASTKKCTQDVIDEYLKDIVQWSESSDTTVIIPTARVDENIYNTGYVVQQGKAESFYKIELTDSEKRFFSPPEEEDTPKVFEVNGYNFGILMCAEAQLHPWRFFEQDDVDCILWPGYWGWIEGDLWGPLNESGEENQVYSNMKEWRVPLVQANFAYNDLDDHRASGPHGLSVCVDANNQMIGQGLLDQEGCYLVELNKDNNQPRLSGFSDLGLIC